MFGGISLNSATFNPDTIAEDITSLVSDGVSHHVYYVFVCVANSAAPYGNKLPAGYG